MTDLDSYMYQTVGHEWIKLLAEALDLPLFQGYTKGQSVNRETNHFSPQVGDEVEDLFDLIKKVQDQLEIDAVSSGAILSDYQRIRVENV